MERTESGGGTAVPLLAVTAPPMPDLVLTDISVDTAMRWEYHGVLYIEERRRDHPEKV